jgi:LuxR family maltose regulon positive regulatory protein
MRAASANQHVADYLLDDVFSRQPRAIREFLMRTSILDKFTAPLCDALGDGATESSADVRQASFALKRIERANLFLIPLDEERRWFRYHHLFRELLAHRLKQTYDSAAIARWHAQASEWLSNEGLIDDALGHALAAGEVQRVADLVEQHRHEPLNADNWRALERWLGLLPEEVVQGRPALLMARAWVLHFKSQTSAMAEVAQEAMGRLREFDFHDPALRRMRVASPPSCSVWPAMPAVGRMRACTGSKRCFIRIPTEGARPRCGRY